MNAEAKESTKQSLINKDCLIITLDVLTNAYSELANYAIENESCGRIVGHIEGKLAASLEIMAMIELGNFDSNENLLNTFERS